jgi:hypothetical protein
MCATVRFPGETTYQKREPEWFPPHMNRDSEECWNPVHLYFRMFHQTCFTSSPYSKHVYMPPSPDKRRERLLHSIRWASCRCFIPHEKRESISLHHRNSWKLSKSALLIWVKCLCMSEESLTSEVQILNLDRNNTMMEPPHWTRTWIATIFGRLLSALDLNYCNYNQNIPETMQHIAKSTFKITNGIGQEHKVAQGQESDMIISRCDWWWHKCTAILSFDWHIFGTQYRIHTLMWNSWCHVTVLELALKCQHLQNQKWTSIPPSQVGTKSKF